ncbi:Na+/H+ antiporter NhaD/arsenite permease-like protein [Azospirillum lipoferum]|uniref:Sodium:proton antiporter n=1 Tax=Azospirillum lipoferum TaxID=193 RepID=A0A5A9GJ55_AZOLI|nr:MULTISPECIES: sodium:proton antiporter [Azospirillum]KAA0594470.1 sodium:proton antiporter [Azospirillum lipoferum]MCP1613220.1 Na+/H+ antiporter NhaD/arsenite permease-like protein [Azospirillum lipoferum]MDW5531419.1 sodium:proton antiporter [Azospirillum sp. NL1]
MNTSPTHHRRPSIFPTALGAALTFGGVLLGAHGVQAAEVAAEVAHAGLPHLDGRLLGAVWVVPFAGILLSIALFPLLAPMVWHHHFGKISAAWALAFLVPFAATFGVDLATYELLHTVLLEYIPFIVLLTALFTVAGGVRLAGSLVGTPLANTVGLALGTVLASLMGTTGASMLLIRPLLRANEHRRHKVHTVVFFIFLVSNVGGSLTPLGDPPLFLGFLKGVDFFWPTVHLLAPMAFLSALLLVIYFGLDLVLHTRDPGRHPLIEGVHEREPIRIEGSVNLLLLIAIVGAVLLSGVWHPGTGVMLYHVTVPLETIVSNLLLLGITGLSLALTSKQSRRLNGFSWGPILEVAKLFAAIFLTIIPAIAILRAGTDGALGAIISAVNEGGKPNPAAYFWAAGILSSFLDNAPTYLIFFNTAGGDAKLLMTDLSLTLTAISAGAVFMGANSYIGNAPNFMVKAIAEERGVAMPSFFGYMAWSCGILVPLLGLTTLVFFL